MQLPVTNIINCIVIFLSIFAMGAENSSGFSVKTFTKLDDKAQKTIQGQTGGSVDSKGCGFIANMPNHILNIPQKANYMRLSVQASGGQPTLLILGPKPEDRFCVLGEASGLQPEISGVWEAGKYQIYVGDRLGENHQFTLNISTQN